MMQSRAASVTILEESDGTVHITVVDWADAERLFVVSDDKLTLDPGSRTGTLSPGGHLAIHQVSPDGETRCIQRYQPNAGEDSVEFDLSAHEPMTVSRAKDRYVEGETWELELESELERALELERE